LISQISVEDFEPLRVLSKEYSKFFLLFIQIVLAKKNSFNQLAASDEIRLLVTTGIAPVQKATRVNSPVTVATSIIAPASELKSLFEPEAFNFL
jgi:hypothetical protein